MANWIQWSPEQEQLWKQWLSDRPQVIKDMVAKYSLRPDKLYRLKTTDQIVKIISLSEDNTVTVHVESTYNQHMLITQLLGDTLDRGVFGISPDDLEECDLPQGVEVVDGSTIFIH